MTLEDFYFISQIIAAIGIILSLIFVGLQIRQSTRQAKVDAADTAHRNFTDWYESITPEQVALNAQAMRDFSSLSGEEQQLVYAFGMRMLINFQEVHSKWSDGSFPDDRWEFWDAWISTIMSPLFDRVWEDRRYMFSTHFQSYIDAKLAEHKGPRQGSAWDLAGRKAENADTALGSQS
ncbi:MAG: hypothetical protein AAF249_11010 [Pseudomonadota bacterium]